MRKYTEKDVSSKEAFQLAIRGELRRSGIIGSITSELRRHIFDAFNERNVVGRHSLARTGYNLEQAAIRSVILEYLIFDGLQQTASVMAAESCFFDDNFLSRRDILKAYGIIPNSTMHSMLMNNNIEKSKGMDNLNSSYEDTIIHILLFHAATTSMDKSKFSVSTQTKSAMEHPLKARQQLDRQLEMINDKYKHPRKDVQDRSDFEGRVEAKLLSIQKECDDRAQKEIQQKMKQFQDEAIASMRRKQEILKQKEIDEMRLELKRDYDNKIQKFINKQDEMRITYQNEGREQEFSLMKERERMMCELDKLKQREVNIENNLELERKKLQIEEQRVQHILMTAEAKLNLAENKEKAFDTKVNTEYERIRTATKQTFEDASNAAKKQSDLYCEELKEINLLHKAISENADKNSQLEVKLSQLQAEKKVLKEQLETSLKEGDEMRLLIKEKDRKFIEDVTLFNKQHEEINSRLLDAERELAHEIKEKESKRQIYSKHNDEIQTCLKATQSQLRKVQSEYEQLAIEKSVLLAELNETKKLFQRSQEALICKGTQGNYYVTQDFNDVGNRIDYRTVVPTKENRIKHRNISNPYNMLPQITKSNDNPIDKIFASSSNVTKMEGTNKHSAKNEVVVNNIKDEQEKPQTKTMMTGVTSSMIYEQDHKQQIKRFPVQNAIKEHHAISSKFNNVIGVKGNMSTKENKTAKNSQIPFTNNKLSPKPIPIPMSTKNEKDNRLNEMESLMTGMTVSMIQQDPEQKIDSPSIHSMATVMTWDISPTKQQQQQQQQQHNVYVNNTGPSLKNAPLENVENDQSKLVLYSSKRSPFVSLPYHNPHMTKDKEKQTVLMVDGNQSVTSQNEESIHTYNMSDFEHEQSNTVVQDKNMGKHHTMINFENQDVTIQKEESTNTHDTADFEYKVSNSDIQGKGMVKQQTITVIEEQVVTKKEESANVYDISDFEEYESNTETQDNGIQEGHIRNVGEKQESTNVYDTSDFEESESNTEIQDRSIPSKNGRGIIAPTTQSNANEHFSISRSANKLSHSLNSETSSKSSTSSLTKKCTDDASFQQTKNISQTSNSFKNQEIMNSSSSSIQTSKDMKMTNNNDIESENTKNSFASEESYKTSSQYESSSSGIEVFNYKIRDKQTDWW